MIKIYTDGSCSGNPGPGGWGVLIFGNASKKILKGHDTDTTNNRMEMTAILNALKWMQKNGHKEATIYSDSNLLIQTFLQNWKKKKNLDLWKEIDKHLENLNIKWEWVKAHAENKYNNEVDEVACEQTEIAMKLPKSKKAHADGPQSALF